MSSGGSERKGGGGGKMLWHADGWSELLLRASGSAPPAVWQLPEHLSKARGSTLKARSLYIKEREPAAPING